MIDAIPGPIVKRVCQVQSSIEAVAKTQFNKQGGYKFASADDIYAAVTRKMGEVGLMIMPIEMEPVVIERVEKEITDERTGAISKKITQWGKFRFGFVLACEESTWFDHRSARSLFIQIIGPQTFNAAESYSQKQYLRGLLKLPTGDMDLDSMPQAETEDDQVSLSAPRKRKSSAAAKREGGTEVFNEIRGKIAEAPTRVILNQLRTLYNDDWSTMPPAWVEILDNEYEDKITFLAMAAQ